MVYDSRFRAIFNYMMKLLARYNFLIFNDCIQLFSYNFKQFCIILSKPTLAFPC